MACRHVVFFPGLGLPAVNRRVIDRPLPGPAKEEEEEATSLTDALSPVFSEVVGCIGQRPAVALHPEGCIRANRPQGISRDCRMSDAGTITLQVGLAIPIAVLMTLLPLIYGIIIGSHCCRQDASRQKGRVLNLCPACGTATAEPGYCSASTAQIDTTTEWSSVSTASTGTSGA